MLMLKKVCGMLFGFDSRDFVYSSAPFTDTSSIHYVFMKSELNSLRLFKWFASLNLKYNEQFGHGHDEQENIFYFWIKD